MEGGGYHRLRILSYNIQSGVDTQRYRQYVTQSWKHLLPHRERLQNLNRIAPVLGQYDLVGLQEVDSGSLRSGFVDQTEYLAHRAGFPFWYKQINRSLGKIAKYSNGLLTRRTPTFVSEHKLPGLPGRGAIYAQFGSADDMLLVCIVHLALGRRSRMRQVEYIAERVGRYPNAIVMGDLNCGVGSEEIEYLLDRGGLQRPVCEKGTFPSWRPMKKLDHILVSKALQVENPRVVDCSTSDHLPIGIDVLVPSEIDIAV
ncbi:MAG: EEP domain-containing protein [Gammaproteobacteria bacterium]|nr:EEP domain-containing protein [Gammaproteobacteria bacterium]